MLRSWFTLVLRHARKYSLFTAVNVASLVIGFTCCIAIVLYVQDELSYEAFHENKARIFRVTTASIYNGEENRYSRTPVPLGELLKASSKDVEHVARVASREATVLIPDRKSKFLERNFCFADAEVLQMFTFRFLSGQSQSALKDVKSALITDQIAEKYFGSVANSIGKTIVIENRLELTVTGVVEHWPVTTHWTPGIITHFENYYALESEGIANYLRTDWVYTSVFTYLLLPDPAKANAITDHVNEIRSSHADERVKESVRYSLQPLEAIHLNSDFTYENNSGAITYNYIFSVVGVLMLVIGCFNFINLSIARSLKRAKEIGMKKALGIDRRSLTVQLFGESMLYVVVAFIVSLAVVYFIVPVINDVSGKQISIDSLFSPMTIGIMVAVILVTAFMAGVYPALHISGINVYKALKGHSSAYTGRFQLRKVLVVVQFFIAITLILFTMVVNRQLEFMRNKSLGFDKDHVITIPLFSDSFNSILGSRIDIDYRKRMIAFEDEVLKNSNIESITCSSFLPGQGAISALIQTDSLTEQSNVFAPLVSVDYDFVEAYGIELVAGRNFSRSFGTDHLQSFIVNEEALRTLGFGSADQAIGKRLMAVGKEGQVVGVIRNYHVQGLQYALQPLVLEVAASKFSSFSVKVNGTQIQEAIAVLKSEWDKFFPESIFEYHFLDEALQQNYENEQRLSRVIGYFSVFTYVIAGLGLFGLAAYINEQRTREVGIRKVLGATMSSIFVTLSSEFVKLISIAFVTAVPVSIFVAVQWLEGFHYKSPIGVTMFFFVLGITALIVLLTISYQTLRATRTNPAEVLKTE